jgi:ubiquinone/menaquinone biosynthesis C-methylase UbiE
VPWDIFDSAAPRYAGWYTTPRGQRAEQAERALLAWLLQPFPQAQSVLEVGCGTGHFTAWLASQGLRVVGLDRAPAMVAEMRRRYPEIPGLMGDAHRLPVRDRAVDLVVFVTTLEFLEAPIAALAEAMRVARQGLLMVVLNRCSLGGLSRRWGRQAHHALLGQAQDYALRALQATVRQAAGPRLHRVRWASTLFPNGLWRVRARMPLGEVLGLAMVL